MGSLSVLSAARPTAPSLGPMLSIKAGDTCVMIGDSITSITHDTTSYWWKTFRETVTATLLGNVTWVDSGVSGAKIDDIVASYLTSAVAFAPQVMVVAIGVNDVIENVKTPATFRARMETFLSSCYASLPNLKVMIQGPWLDGDAKPDGSNANDTLADAYVAQNAACASARGIPHVDTRAAYFNGPDTSGTLTVDGVHPLILGAQRMSVKALERVIVG